MFSRFEFTGVVRSSGCAHGFLIVMSGVFSITLGSLPAIVSP